MDPLLLPLLFIAVLALPLILGSRRQKKAAAEAQRLQSSLTVGDRVMTTSGMLGTVVDTSDEAHVDLEIAPGVRTTWLRAAIREKLTENDSTAEADSAADDEADEVDETEDAARADDHVRDSSDAVATSSGRSATEASDTEASDTETVKAAHSDKH